MAEKEGVKLRDLLAPCFVAMSGAPVALPLFETMELVGSDMTRRRLTHALDLMAAAGTGLKGKALAQVEKEYRARYG